MMHRILLAMDGSPHADAAAALAIAWGRRFGAELVGLGVLDEPAIRGAEAMLRLGDAHRQIQAFLAGFRRRCDEVGVRCTVAEAVGQPHERIVLEAQGCDVVMLGRETNFHFATPERLDRTLGQVLRASPRPVVVVPREPLGGEGVLVAYGGGTEIARMLHAVMLLGLAAGETVTLLAVAAERGEAEERLLRPQALLAAHGIATDALPVESEAPAAEVILDAIRDRRPRLLVMGAQGQHPVRDLFVTSVTRAVMKATPVPLMAGA